MRKLLIIWLSVVSCVAVSAQDSLIMNDTLPERIIQYADTFKLQEQSGAIEFDEEAILLDLLAQQAIVLQAREDSIRQVEDSIRAAELLALQQDSAWLAEQDSIRHALEMAAYQAMLDSIAREEEELRQLKEQLMMSHALMVDSAYLNVEVPIKSLMKDAEEDRQDKLRAMKKYSPWFKEASGLLQFSQNYVSSNWHQGGNSSFAMLTSLKGFIKYDDRKWITWENTGEWREGFSTSRGDSLRKVNMTDDLFKLYSKFNIKIIPKKLYGSFSGEFQTPLFRTWKDNQNSLKTGFFTPLRFNLALGVDYKPGKVKDLSLVFAPMAYKLVYVNDTVRADRNSFGVSSGNVLSTLGSSVRVEWKWQPLREVALETVFYAYTNYKMIELDWEITCDFIINRYMSSRLVLHPRYDSSAKQAGEERAKMQFKEFISIGFAHKFH